MRDDDDDMEADEEDGEAYDDPLDIPEEET